jgi:hypothetical protein
MIGAEENVDSKQVAPNAGNAVPVWRQIDAGSFRILRQNCHIASVRLGQRKSNTGRGVLEIGSNRIKQQSSKHDRCRSTVEGYGMQTALAFEECLGRNFGHLCCLFNVALRSVKKS